MRKAIPLSLNLHGHQAAECHADLWKSAENLAARSSEVSIQHDASTPESSFIAQLSTSVHLPRPTDTATLLANFLNRAYSP